MCSYVNMHGYVNRNYKSLSNSRLGQQKRHLNLFICLTPVGGSHVHSRLRFQLNPWYEKKKLRFHIRIIAQ